MSYKILQGDCRDVLKDFSEQSVHCCVTSPPYYGLRDYGCEGQIGLEQTPDEYVAELVAVFREVKRVLRDDGTVWLNLGDSYYNTSPGSCGKCVLPGAGRAMTEGRYHDSKRDFTGTGLKPKDLIGIPWRVAFALQSDGWYLRQDIIWYKPNPMPESVTDRCTKAHEYIFLLSKSARYWYDAEAIREELKLHNKGMMRAPKCGEGRPAYNTLSDNSGNVTVKQYDEIKGANRRSVWTITTKPYSDAHFATFPPAVVEPCILAGCPGKCCPKCGTGWVNVTVKKKSFESGSGKSGNRIVGKQDLSAKESNSTPDIRRGPCISSSIVGFRPLCSCYDDLYAEEFDRPKWLRKHPQLFPYWFQRVKKRPGKSHWVFEKGKVLDPFAGSGTTGMVAEEKGRDSILVELNPDYVMLIKKRVSDGERKGKILSLLEYR